MGVSMGEAPLPPALASWFSARGWSPHPHQMAMLASARAGRSALLIAPTGAGKTLAGFLGSLAALCDDPSPRLHTLYVSPLKALAADIARNLTAPIAGMGLAVTVETRTGDTGAEARRRQRTKPPHLLLTTPESLALLLSLPEAGAMFAGLAAIVVDEIHALAGTKRGDQLSLCLARLATLAPRARRVGLSATVPHRAPLVAFLSASGRAEAGDVDVIVAPGGADPALSVMLPEGQLPWSGHMGLLATPDIYRLIRDAGTSIVFVNTRAQAELVFQALWRLNDDGLPIALHHGSLAREQRERVEARRRGCRDCCSVSAVPTTAGTRPRARCSCRPTGSRCWNAAPPWMAWPRMTSTATRHRQAGSTCWPSTCSAWRPPRRSGPTISTPR